MYCYKLNNSYTVYVNYAYLNDCIKACQNKHKYIAPSKKTSHKQVATAPPDNMSVYHKAWGRGKVITSDSDGVITVEFPSHTARFVYPDAFIKGYLVRA